MRTVVNLEKTMESIRMWSIFFDKVCLEWKLFLFTLTPCITTIRSTNHHTMYRERVGPVVYEITFDARTGAVQSIMYNLDKEDAFDSAKGVVMS